MRADAAALIADSRRGPDPTPHPGVAGWLLHRLRTLLERVLRRRFDQQSSIDERTVALLIDLLDAMQAELAALRTLTQRSDELDERSQLTESRLDELTLALFAAAPRLDGASPAATPR